MSAPLEQPDPDQPPEAQRVPWTWLDAVWVFLLTLVAGILVLAPLVQVLREVFALSEGAALAVSFSVFLALLGVVCLLYVRARFPGHVADLAGATRARLRHVLGGLGHGVVAFLVINLGLLLALELIAGLAGEELPTVQEEVQQAVRAPDAFFYVLVGTVFVAPVAEELFFRGMLFQALAGRLGRWPGIGFSAVAFALAHAEPGDLQASLLVFVAIFPLGMYLAWLFDRRGSLAAPIATHAAFNLLGVLGILTGFA